MTAHKFIVNCSSFIVHSLIAIVLLLVITHYLLPVDVYAQVGGTGAEVIRPIERLWQLSRNISYLFLTVVLLVIGLMIMLRSRINPQTVVGLQQALPGVVIALIVITFSYFIVSLIIDLAFLLAQTFSIAVMAGFGMPLADAQIRTANALNNYSIFALFLDALNIPTLINAANVVGGGIADALVNEIPFIGGILGFFGAGNFTGSAIATLVLLVALLNSFFRLFFALITAFVTIFISTILGPFFILFSAIPGRGQGLSNWIRGLVANVLIFPVVFMVFVLVAVLLNRSGATGGPWSFPGATGAFNQPLPLFGGIDPEIVRFFLAYGIILATPGIPDFIRNTIGTPTPPQLGQAVTQGTQAGQGALGNVLKIIKI